MRILVLVTVMLSAVMFIASTSAQNVSIKRQNVNILPTATVTAVPTPVAADIPIMVEATTPTVSRAVTTIGSEPVSVPAPPTMYFSRSGRPRQPCTKRRPCDIDTGRQKLRERVFAQALVFFGLTPEQISDLVMAR